jgi:hypothetical protein
MTLQLRHGCNLVNLRGIRSITLLWLVVVVAVTQLQAVVELEVCFPQQRLYHLVRHTPSQLDRAALVQAHQLLRVQMV